MNIKQLKEIIKLFEESDLAELEVNEGEEHLRLKRKAEPVALLPQTEPQRAAEAPLSPAPAQIKAPDPVDFNHVIEVTSPVVGVFYEAPEPGGKPFIKVGDHVQRGDILCLIEVMKQVTEVTAPQNGRVADICVTNGNVVEYGQTLVKIC